MRASGLRRMALILASVAALAPVGPAMANTCEATTEAEVGQPLAINLGIPAETSAVVSIEVTLPEAFRLEDAEPEGGWVTQREGRRLRFTGGTVPPFGCANFTLWGEVTRRGKLAFPLTTHNEDGTTSEYHGDRIGDPYSAQIVFAGVEPKLSDYDDDGGSNVMLLAAVGLVGLGLGAGVVLFAGRRRAAASRTRG